MWARKTPVVCEFIQNVIMHLDEGDGFDSSSRAGSLAGPGVEGASTGGGAMRDETQGGVWERGGGQGAEQKPTPLTGLTDERRSSTGWESLPTSPALGSSTATARNLPNKGGHSGRDGRNSFNSLGGSFNFFSLDDLGGSNAAGAGEETVSASGMTGVIRGGNLAHTSSSDGMDYESDGSGIVGFLETEQSEARFRLTFAPINSPCLGEDLGEG